MEQVSGLLVSADHQAFDDLKAIVESAAGGGDFGKAAWSKYVDLLNESPASPSGLTSMRTVTSMLPKGSETFAF